jgi:hypothetical protein
MVVAASCLVGTGACCCMDEGVLEVWVKDHVSVLC